MKIQTVNVNLYGGKVNLPDIGIKDVSDEGIVEVPEEIGKQILADSITWKLFKEEDEKDLKKKLLKMDLISLQQFASDSGFPEESYGKLKKVELVNFLIEQTKKEE